MAGVVFAGGGRPVLIESLWDESRKPTAEVIARYRGKRVEVVGTLNAQPPGAIANIAVPCVSPVELVRVVGGVGRKATDQHGETPTTMAVQPN